MCQTIDIDLTEYDKVLFSHPLINPETEKKSFGKELKMITIIQKISFERYRTCVKYCVNAVGEEPRYFGDISQAIYAYNHIVLQIE